MLAFGIRYLNGFVAAAEPDDLKRAEWPPHPGRVFMALAAAHFETGADTAERAALLWLEGTERGGEISAPAIVAPAAIQRAIVRHYVPVNDKAGPSKLLMHSLPLTRDRYDRVFARAWLEDDMVYLLWPELEAPPLYCDALARLCTNVTRIGHSSSLVQMWLVGSEQIGEPNWVPDDDRAIVHLRISGPGTLDYLEQQYNEAIVEDYAALKVTELEADDPKVKRAAKRRLRTEYGNQPPPRQRPHLALYQGYAYEPHSVVTEASHAKQTVFSPHPLMLKLTLKGGPYRVIDLVSTLAVIDRWHAAILSYSNSLSESVRRILSGHNAQGGPADGPHLAFLPLAFVGHEHADGHLLGMGLVLPANLSRDDRREALRAIATVREIRLGPLGVWMIEPVITSNPAWNLKPEAWTASASGATHWSTVTPIVFDRHPKAKEKAQYQQEVSLMIAKACTRISLPTLREIIVTHVSAHFGVPPAFNFPRLKRKDGSACCHTHAILVFDEPVCGPVLVGAGRYRGYGACRPLDAEDDNQ